MAVCTGSCKWFDSTKGYGFITTSEGDEVFVHQSEIHARGFRSLAGGEEVQCVVVEDMNGKKKATNVKGLDGGYVRGDTDSVRQQSNSRQFNRNAYNNNNGRRIVGNNAGFDSFRQNNNRSFRNNYGSPNGGNNGEYYNSYYD